MSVATTPATTPAIREALGRWLLLIRDPDCCTLDCLGALTRGDDPQKWAAMLRARLAYQDALAAALAEAHAPAEARASTRKTAR